MDEATSLWEHEPLLDLGLMLPVEREMERKRDRTRSESVEEWMVVTLVTTRQAVC